MCRWHPSPDVCIIVTTACCKENCLMHRLLIVTDTQLLIIHAQLSIFSKLLVLKFEPKCFII